MAWFKREKQKIAPIEKKGVPDGTQNSNSLRD